MKQPDLLATPKTQHIRVDEQQDGPDSLIKALYPDGWRAETAYSDQQQLEPTLVRPSRLQQLLSIPSAILIASLIAISCWHIRESSRPCATPLQSSRSQQQSHAVTQQQNRGTFLTLDKVNLS